MTNSYILRLFAKANRDAAKFLDCEHYNKYADQLDDRAAVYEAEEIVSGQSKQ